MELKIILGDITKVKADAIVNAANNSLLGGGGVDGAIHRAAGPRLLDECRKLKGCETGEAKITKGYNLPAKFVIHTVGPIWQGGNHGEAQLLTNCYINSLKLAEEYNCHHVSFPSISTGVYHFPLEKASKIAVKSIMEYCKDKYSINNVEIVCFDEKTKKYYSDALMEIFINRLIFISSPENRDKYEDESELIGIIYSLAFAYEWESLGDYTKYIEMTERAIENNSELPVELDLNTTIATLIYILRDQYWNGGCDDTIGPRISNGQMIKLAKRLKEIV